MSIELQIIYSAPELYPQLKLNLLIFFSFLPSKVSQDNFENLKARNHRILEPNVPVSEKSRKTSDC